MLDIANDIRSLSDFKRKTSELIARLKTTGETPSLPLTDAQKRWCRMRQPTSICSNGSKRSRRCNGDSPT